MATIGDYEQDSKGRPLGVVRIVTAAGTPIFLLPVETFPGHVNNIYLVASEDYPILFDVGTRTSHEQLQSRFGEVKSEYGCSLRLRDVKVAIVSHAHVDHFGNAGNVRRVGIPIAIHELDARVLLRFAERLTLAARDMKLFLAQAGVPEDESSRLIALYRAGKTFFEDQEPDRRLRNGDLIGPGYRVLHVPGHCPGMICLAVDDVILTADHLLSRITPIQSPQSITPYVGLENYLRSLEKLRAFGPFDLGLGAHEAPIRAVERRIDETMVHHFDRLRKVGDLLAGDGHTIAETADLLFGEQQRYGRLLALLETAAHVEYLYEYGSLVIANIEEVADDTSREVRYRQIPGEPSGKAEFLSPRAASLHSG